MVCPTSLRKGLFTTAAVDNIDHNPNSTTSNDSFHGARISLFQHTSTQFSGEEREAVTLEQTTFGTKAVSQLPESFTNLPPVVLQNKDSPVPQHTVKMKEDFQALKASTTEELQWLDTVMETTVRIESFKGDKSISWAAYHSSEQKQTVDIPLVISGLMPLFPDQAKSVAMIQNSIDVIKKAIEHQNPGQIPVVAMDQPLFTIGK